MRTECCCRVPSRGVWHHVFHLVSCRCVCVWHASGTSLKWQKRLILTPCLSCPVAPYAAVPSMQPCSTTPRHSTDPGARPHPPSCNHTTPRRRHGAPTHPPSCKQAEDIAATELWSPVANRAYAANILFICLAGVFGSISATCWAAEHAFNACKRIANVFCGAKYPANATTDPRCSPSQNLAAF